MADSRDLRILPVNLTKIILKSRVQRMKRQQMMLFLLRRRNRCMKLAILTAMLVLTKAKEDTEIPVFRSCRRLQRSKECWKTERLYR